MGFEVSHESNLSISEFLFADGKKTTKKCCYLSEYRSMRKRAESPETYKNIPRYTKICQNTKKSCQNMSKHTEECGNMLKRNYRNMFGHVSAYFVVFRYGLTCFAMLGQVSV